MKKLRHGVLLTTFLLLSFPVAADTLERVLDDGSIRIGLAIFEPWAMKNADGELRGFEIDVASKLAADMGVKPVFKVYHWDALIPALDSGEIDVIGAGMAITPQRALKVNFSRPLAITGVGLALNTKLTRNVKTLAALNQDSVTLAVVKETLADGVSRTLFDHANIKLFPTNAEAEQALLDGRAHGYVGSTTEVNFLMLRNKDVVDLPLSEPLVAASEAFGVKKGEQELLNFLDAWVTARQSDKWLSTTRDYWFGSLQWVEDASGK